MDDEPLVPPAWMADLLAEIVELVERHRSALLEVVEQWAKNRPKSVGLFPLPRRKLTLAEQASMVMGLHCAYGRLSEPIVPRLSATAPVLQVIDGQEVHVFRTDEAEKSSFDDQWVETVFICLTRGANQVVEGDLRFLRQIVDNVAAILEGHDLPHPTITQDDGTWRARGGQPEPSSEPLIVPTADQSQVTLTIPASVDSFVFAPDGTGYFIAGFDERGHVQKLKGFDRICQLIQTP